MKCPVCGCPMGLFYEKDGDSYICPLCSLIFGGILIAAIVISAIIVLAH